MIIGIRCAACGAECEWQTSDAFPHERETINVHLEDAWRIHKRECPKAHPIRYRREAVRP